MDINFIWTNGDRLSLIEIYLMRWLLLLLLWLLLEMNVGRGQNGNVMVVVVLAHRLQIVAVSIPATAVHHGEK